jgi:hypothetical protein
MAEGDKTYLGLAAPLNGEYEQFQITVATDMVTLTGGASQTGDFLVCQNSSGTEKFVIDKDGYITASRVNLGAAVTTPPTTGLTKGELFVVFSTSSPVLAICTSTAGKTIKYISPFDSKTLGRTT